MLAPATPAVAYVIVPTAFRHGDDRYLPGCPLALAPDVAAQLIAQGLARP